MTKLERGFDIEIDEEQVCRVLDHDPDDVMSFTVGDFGRFLTEFLYAVRLDGEIQ